MSDLKSSVHNEQISDAHSVTDNTDPLAPLAEEPAISDSAEIDAENDLSPADQIEYVDSIEKHEAEELMSPMKPVICLTTKLKSSMNSLGE
jgi:hypothetical protein